MAAHPYEVLLYEDFDYKISFHTKEKDAWKNVDDDLLYDDAIQHKDFFVGQIDDFPKETCANLYDINMRLEPTGLVEHKVHPNKAVFSDEGVTFTSRIKPCTKVAHDAENNALESLLPKGQCSSQENLTFRGFCHSLFCWSYQCRPSEQ